jgi:rhodanese-related sulfurtransferase
MPSRRLTCLSLVLATSFAFATAVSADTVKGRIDDISNKGSTIKLTPEGQPPATVMFGPETQYVNAASIKDLGPPDLIEVEFTPGKPASKITKVVFGLPPGAEVSLQELEAIRAGKEPFVLVDARPEKQYVTGHLPGTINIFPKDLPNRLNELPADKSTMVIFYCGGPTCPYTGQSIEIAAKAGHTNLKGFQAGIPAWKKAGKPVVASPSWVAAGLGPNTVVIDVRAKADAEKSRVKGAVSMEAAQFPAMTQKFIAEKQVARLPGVADMAAPIVVYGDSDTSQDVLTAYGELKKYQYKNAAILKGGYAEWAKLGLPSESGPATTQISYVKKLKPGAVPREEFAKLVDSRGDTILLDVREDKEVADGKLPGALHLSIDKLQADPSALPKDKPVIAYCSNGIRSEMAYDFLKKNGFEQVRFLNESLVVKKDGSYVFE